MSVTQLLAFSYRHSIWNVLDNQRYNSFIQRNLSMFFKIKQLCQKKNQKAEYVWILI